jgi:SNF family Na+-dependent transporter
LLAVLFYLGVFFAGFSSLIALVEAVINPYIKVFKCERKKVLVFFLLGLLLCSTFFIFQFGYFLIYSFDYFQTGFFLPFLLFGEILLFNCNPVFCQKIFVLVKKNTTLNFLSLRSFKILFFYVFPAVLLVNFSLCFYKLLFAFFFIDLLKFVFSFSLIVIFIYYFLSYLIVRFLYKKQQKQVSLL